MGIESRDYLRHSGSPRQEAFHWQLPVVLTAFWIGCQATREGRVSALVEWLCVSTDGLAAGQIWRLFTYGLIHLDLLHLFFNCLGIYMFGRNIAQWHGDRFAWKAWAWGVLGGGVVWSVIYLALGHPGSAIGASAGVSCLLTGWCLHHYRDKVTLIVYFIPLSLTGRAWLILFFAIDFLFMIFSELNPNAKGGVAHTAHLGGFLAALVLFSKQLEPWKVAEMPLLRPFLSLHHWLNPVRKTKREPGIKPSENQLDTPSGTPSQAEVDRILDKINEHGFGSLTPAEKSTLERARRK